MQRHQSWPQPLLISCLLAWTDLLCNFYTQALLVAELSFCRADLVI